MDTVIVAIPSHQNYVWNISSETTPHLTLLVLGADPNNLQQIVEFVGHAAQNSSLCRFGLSVDRRDVLGDNEADVLFFTKDWCIEKLMNFRSYLLQDPNIKTAYDSVDQFPDWLPHLTLGYPETPAKKDERDYPGFSWIQFDKIAVWTEDYSGPEFNLKSSYGLEVSMSDIKHYGVRGMHWGKRKGKPSLSENSHNDAVKAHDAKAKIKQHGLHSLSNDELQSLTRRMNLEKQLKDLGGKNKGTTNAGAKFLKDAGRQVLMQQVTGTINKEASKKIESFLTSQRRNTTV